MNISKINLALQNLGQICQSIDSCTKKDDRKKLFFEVIESLGVDLSGPRARQAFDNFIDGDDSTEAILLKMVEFENKARQSWIDTALKPWCDRHQLTLKQGLSVLFDDNAFNPQTRCDDLVSRERVLGWSGQQDCFAHRLMAEIDQQEKNLFKKVDEKKDCQALNIHGVQRWDVMNGTEIALENEPTYNIRVIAGGGDVLVDVVPMVHKEIIDPAEGDLGLHLPQLSVVIEIHNGAPCVHVYRDSSGQPSQTVFALPDGRVALRCTNDPLMRKMVFQVDEEFNAPLNDIARLFDEAAQASVQDSDLNNSALAGESL